MDSIATPQPVQREPAENEIAAARDLLAQLEAEARAVGRTPAAAPVHYAMGRIWIEQLGDQRSAAVCYQNAFQLNPEYRPNLEAARRLFESAGRLERALALHQREERLLTDPAQQAESLRAQARLLRELNRNAEADATVQRGLALAPEHPALLEAAVEAAQREGQKTESIQLLLRSAGATRDPVYKAQLLRRALLLSEELLAEANAAPVVAALHDEAVRKLSQADGNDPVGWLASLLRARAQNDWEAVLRLCRQRAERTASAADRALVAAIAAFRLGRVSEGLAEVNAALEDNRRDGTLLALRGELAELQKSPDLAEVLRQRAEACIDASERAHLKLRAATLLADPLERENLLSEALAENPGDAAAIALHARLVAQREPTEAAQRFATLGESLQEHSPEEAAAQLFEAGVWYERAQAKVEAAEMARRALQLLPRHAGALRLLCRTLPASSSQGQAPALLEEAAAHLPRALGAELLSRAAVLYSDDPELRGHALLLAQRAAELARGLTSPRGLEVWSSIAFRTGDLAQLSQALEARADSTQGTDAADLLLEASEVARAVGDDARSTALLRKARGVDPQSPAARNALLALPTLPAADRVELLLEEARSAEPARAAALHAERAAVLEAEGRNDEAVQASAQALALAGADLAVLRRLARLQLRRGDHAAALAVLVQIAEAVAEGPARAEAYGRAAELAEWRVGDPRRAAELYRSSTEADPQAAFAWAQLARLHAWNGEWTEAAGAFEKLAAAAQTLSERNEARRWAASLLAHRAAQPGQAAPLLRALLAESPGDLEAMAELLALIQGASAEARRERAELRGQLASRCQDPRVAALLRVEGAEDWFAAGDREQGVAEYRRALALNPQDRIALDAVEEALRASGEKTLLAEHLAFRCSYADGDTRAALSLQQAEIFTEQGQMEEAGKAYHQALASDPDSLLAVKGARHVAELTGDKQEVMRLLAREAVLSHDPGLAAGSLVEAALLAEDMGDREQSVQHLTAVLAQDPANADAASRLRHLYGDEAPQQLVAIYQRLGQDHADARKGAQAWALAAAIQDGELKDPAAAFLATGRALARDAGNAQALELRASTAESTGRFAEAADALQKRIALGGAEAEVAGWKARLGHAWAGLGDAPRALPLLGDALDTLPPATLLKLAPGARELQQADATRLYARLVAAFPAPQDPPSRAQLGEWTDELARGLLAQGRRDEALGAFRRAVELEPRNRAALRHVAELAAQTSPDEAIAAHRALLEMSPPAADSLHALFALLQPRPDAAFCAAAALVALNQAQPEEKAYYEVAAARPPPVELPQLTDGAVVHAPSGEGAVRELLGAAAAELARALPTEVGGGRAALVKGDNPVRRVVAAIARALAIPEPQLFLARNEPAIVAPVAGEAPGLLVGAEVPKRFTPRQQRFLYARALAHLRRGTQAVAGLPPQRLATVVGELIRLTAPQGTDLTRLPAADAALAEALARAVTPEARTRLAPLALRAAAELPTNWEPLALGIRESAERAALAVAGDPAAAIGLVAAEVQGGLEKPEVARLVRFAVSEPYLALRK